MTSLLTNNSANNALQALRGVNGALETSQNRIATGLKVESAKDNSAYYQISKSMTGDNAAYQSINEGLTLAKNSVATARLGAETIQKLATNFLEKVAFAQGAKGGFDDIANDLKEIVKQMKTTLSQSTFNGDDMLGAGATAATAGTVTAATGALARTGASTAATNTPAVAATRTVVTGITRAGGADVYKTTSITVATHDMMKLVTDFDAITTDFATNAKSDANGEAFLAGILGSTEGVLADVTAIATKLGQSEKSIETQQNFLTKLVDNIDGGIGAMVDADMEEEAARLKALQTQQQLATQALSIANAAPENVLTLFRG